MKTIWVRSSAFDIAAKYVKTMKLPYEIHETSSSRAIKNKVVCIRTSSNYLGVGILSHLIRCKAEIMKNAKEKDLLIPVRLKWFGLSEELTEDLPPRKMFVNEFDLNHAYWSVAFRLGFIGKETYDKFLKFKTKHFRLIALGMLAKREYVQYYDEEGNKTESEVKVDELGVQIFRKIANEVAVEMERLSKLNPEAFRFFWFDNIVFDTTVRKLETEYSYKWFEQIMELKFIPRRKVMVRIGEPGEQRDFSFPISSDYIQRSIIPF